MDLGTLRKTELFVTDARLEIIPMVEELEYVSPLLNEEVENKVQEILDRLENK